MRNAVHHCWQKGVGKYPTPRNGAGKTAEEVLERYDRAHRMNQFGYGKAQMDMQISGHVLSKLMIPGNAKFIITTISGYSATRGREQQLYDKFKLAGYSMGNTYNPVWRYNPLAPTYWMASNLAFGPLTPYAATYK